MVIQNYIYNEEQLSTIYETLPLCNFAAIKFKKTFTSKKLPPSDLHNSAKKSTN